MDHCSVLLATEWPGWEGLLLCNCAGEFYARFYPPVPFVQSQRLMVVEFAAIEAAHVVIAFQTTVLDVGSFLLFGRLLCSSLIDPFRITPVVFANRLEKRLSACDCLQCVDEFIIPLLCFACQENHGIMPPAVEMLLEGSYRGDGAVPLAISHQHDDYGIFSVFRSNVDRRLSAAGGEGRIERYAGPRDMVAIVVEGDLKDASEEYEDGDAVARE